jgi:hypothetical protein
VRLCIKLSLCLIKHHAVKTCGTRCKWLVSFNRRPIDPRRNRGTHWGWMDPGACLGNIEERKMFFSCRERNVTYPTVKCVAEWVILPLSYSEQEGNVCPWRIQVPNQDSIIVLWLAYGPDVWEIVVPFPAGLTVLSPLHSIQTASCSMGTEVKRPKRETDHSVRSSADVTMSVTEPPFLLYIFMACT